MLVAMLLLLLVATILEGAWPHKSFPAAMMPNARSSARSWLIALTSSMRKRRDTSMLRRAAVPKLAPHRETGAEPGLDGSSSAEGARGIEALRVRVADDVQ